MPSIIKLRHEREAKGLGSMPDLRAGKVLEEEKELKIKGLGGSYSVISPLRDEDIILTSCGGYFDDANLRWELGVFCLTSKRLLFLRDNGLALKVPLEEISDFEVGRKTSSFYGRKMLRLAIGKNGGGEESRVWCSLMDVAGWASILKRHIPMGGNGVGETK